jgi:ribonuclease P/MRP protein subunit POP5
MVKIEKRRYLLLKIESDLPIEKKLIFNIVQDSVLRFFGEYGASKANLKVIKVLPEKKEAVIRSSHIMVEKVRASIASITSINGKPATIHVENISGTIKALFKKTNLN